MYDDTEDKLAVVSMIFCGVAFILGLVICIGITVIFGRIAGICTLILMLVGICLLLLKVAKSIMKERDEKLK